MEDWMERYGYVMFIVAIGVIVAASVIVVIFG